MYLLLNHSFKIFGKKQTNKKKTINSVMKLIKVFIHSFKWIKNLFCLVVCSES